MNPYGFWCLCVWCGCVCDTPHVRIRSLWRSTKTHGAALHRTALPDVLADYPAKFEDDAIWCLLVFVIGHVFCSTHFGGEPLGVV